jgi:phospholipase/carboxylesterase
LLHGIGSNEDDLIELAPALDARFFLLSARAPLILQPGAFAWFHVQFTPTGFLIQPEQLEQSRKALLKFLDEVTANYDVDPKRVYLAGFSQGSIMSVALSITEPRRFAGVVAMSGRLVPDLLPQVAPESEIKGLPVLMIHGTDDTVIPVEYGRNARDQLQQLGVDLEYREYPMGHHVTPASMTDIQRWLAARLDSKSDWREKNKA